MFRCCSCCLSLRPCFPFDTTHILLITTVARSCGKNVSKIWNQTTVSLGYASFADLSRLQFCESSTLGKINPGHTEKCYYIAGKATIEFRFFF